MDASIKNLYSAKEKDTSFITIPRMKFFTISGKGTPSSKEFQLAIQALYRLAYTVKINLKKGTIERPNNYADYKVAPLEALWITTGTSFDITDPETYVWKAMLMQPQFINEELFDIGIALASKKKGLPYDNVRLEEIEEGLSAQALHLGSYSDEQPTIELLHEFVDKSGYIISGPHHEIYLNDPNRTAPDKLKTIIRYPVMEMARDR